MRAAPRLPRALVVGALAAGAGCAAPVPPAPGDLDGLARYLFRYSEDEGATDAGAASLDAWLAENPPEGETGLRLTALSEEDVAGIPRPDGEPGDAIGAVAWAASPHDIDAHLELALYPHQSEVLPDEYSVWERTLTEGGDCFAARACEVLRTENEVLREFLPGIVVPYALLKNYRWAEYEGPDGQPREALVARGWVPEVSLTEDGVNGVLQSYHVDVLVQDPAGGTLRVQAQWGETKTALGDLLTEDFLLTTTLDGIHETFEATDAWLDARGG